jgi:hypothetical protein
MSDHCGGLIVIDDVKKKELRPETPRKLRAPLHGALATP